MAWCKKVPYDSRAMAKTAIKQLNRQFANGGLKDAYFCDKCDAWHITSMEKKKSRALTARRNKWK